MRPFAIGTIAGVLAVAAVSWIPVLRAAQEAPEIRIESKTDGPAIRAESLPRGEPKPAPGEATGLAALAGGPASARLPGVDLAAGITQITGVAISPLLGVSCLGAWHHFRTPPAQRPQLPWFCHPLAWGVGFVILGLCLLKDVLGTAAPPLIKKPLDIAELIENKLSALVVSAAFVPLISRQMIQAVSGAAESSQWLTSSQAAAASVLPFQLGWFGLDLTWLVLPLCVLGFLVVWLASHTINVLIILCPFGFIDVLLKLARLTLLGLLLLAYVINPYLGLLLSLLILLGALVIAGWTFRLMMFGLVMTVDLVVPGRGRRRAQPERPHGFLARATGGLPVRTYGRLTCTPDGTLQFSYRPWWVMPRRSVTLATGPLVLAKGMLFPSLMLGASEGGSLRSLIMFMPRYRGQERDLAAYLGVTAVREGVFRRGSQAIRAWFTDMISWRRSGSANGWST